MSSGHVVNIANRKSPAAIEAEGLKDNARFLSKSVSDKNRAIVLRVEGDCFVVGITEPDNYIRKTEIQRVLRISPDQIVFEHIVESVFAQFFEMAYLEDDLSDPDGDMKSVGWEELVATGRSDWFASTETGAVTGQTLGEDSKGVLAFVHKLIVTAEKSRASDIHIEPGINYGCIRFRIDGLLYDHITKVPREKVKTISAALANVAGIHYYDITKLPKDAALRVDNPNRRGRERTEDVRASFLPDKGATKITLRLPQAEIISDLSSVGFTSDQLAMVRDATRSPFGLLLITGPTGSGKSNTAEAMLRELEADNGRSIVQLGSPIEIRRPNRTQIDIYPPDCTWISAMNCVLRSDPDIISPGEFRNAEEADIVVNAALSGHLVVSTCHTNDIAGTFLRLEELGVTPSLQREVLRLIISQRLLRLLCNNCKEEDGHEGGSEIFRSRPRGCRMCNGTGYRGRTAVAEVLPITPNVKSMISAKMTGDEIVSAARTELGVITVHEAAMGLLMAGRTTRFEVDRVTKTDAFAKPKFDSVPTFKREGVGAVI